MKKILLLAVLLHSVILQAQQIPDYNRNHRFVSDFANILTDDEERSIQSTLNGYEKQTGVEIAVVTQNDLQGYEIEDYANKLFNTWGIGKKGLDNGLLILISPTNRKWRIETGYGLEGDLPDMVCHRLSEEYFPTNFRKEEYFNGINGILSKFISILGTKSPEEKAREIEIQRKREEAERQASIDTFLSWFIVILVLLIVIVVSCVIFSKITEKKRKREVERLAEENRIKKREQNIEKYSSKSKILLDITEKLKELYSNIDKRILNNEEVYNRALKQNIISIDNLKEMSDENIDVHLRLLENYIAIVEQTITMLNTNSNIQLESVKQFQAYNNTYNKLNERIPNFIKSVQEFDLIYPELYKYKNRDMYNILDNISQCITRGIEMLDTEFLSTATFDKIKKLNNTVTSYFNELGTYSSDFEKLKSSVNESEKIISTITVKKLNELMLIAETAIKQPHVTSITNRNHSLYKKEFDTFKTQLPMLNIIQKASSLKNIEMGFLSIPKCVEKDIKDYHAELKRKEEEEEKEKEEKRKKKIRDEEENNRTSSYSFGSFGSNPSDSGGSFGLGSSGGGGDTGGW